MSKKKMEWVIAHLTQALALLNNNSLSEFLEHMAVLGEWLQTDHSLLKHKGSEEALKKCVASLQLQITSPITPSREQTLTLEVLQNAWKDSSLARLQTIAFVNHIQTSGTANSCQIVRLPTTPPSWRIVPFNAQGQQMEPLNLDKIDSDVMDLLAQREQKGNDQAIEARLLQALRRANLETVDQRSLRAKAVLSKENRHRIHLGLEAFKLLCPKKAGESKEAPLSVRFVEQEAFAEHFASRATPHYVVLCPTSKRKGRVWFVNARGQKREIKKTLFHKLFKFFLEKPLLTELETLLQAGEQSPRFKKKISRFLFNYHFQTLDEAAIAAIRNYRTSWQKLMHAFEVSVAALASFNYGGVSVVATLIGLFVAASITWTNPLLAIVGILLLASAAIAPFFSTWTNWKFFSTYLTNFFGKIGAEYREIHTAQKKLLFWGLAAFALATGVASGALAYTATIALPTLLGLSALHFIFPPLGVIFAAAIAISQGVSLIRNFCDILRKENSWKAFKQPFAEVRKLLLQNNASLEKRIATWLMVGGLTLLAALGLVMSCFTSTRSVGKFFIDQFMTAPDKALICGIAISAVASFLSRIYATVSSAMAFSTWMCKRLFEGAQRISLKKAASIAFDSVLTGLFYLWSMIHLTQKTPEELKNDTDLHISGLSTVPTILLATAGFFTSGARALSLNMRHAGKPPDPTEAAQQKASSQRIQEIQAFYVKQNADVITRPLEGNDNIVVFNAETFSKCTKS